jgi:transcriptional regulator with XRE-family HTH domain
MARTFDAERLRSERQRCGLSGPALAQRAGLSRAAVFRLESGSRPDPCVSTVAGLARALGLPLDALVKEAS